MDSRNYIPISQHLTSADGEPKNIKQKDKFTFIISSQNDESANFSVYKSLACFLSDKASQQIKANQNSLEIKYLSSDFLPQEVCNQLKMLLSGKPIVINENNFQIFQEILNLLGKRDFDLYFNKEMPETPEDFYLSIHSLKDTDSKFYESSY
jgi:hypothetical protein